MTEITWILGEVTDANYKKLMVVREAAGSDAEGNNYSGLAYFFAGNVIRECMIKKK